MPIKEPDSYTYTNYTQRYQYPIIASTDSNQTTTNDPDYISM